ncbi:hypothetical protein [Pseudoalteromonas 'SMAR']|uniref:hypothetical protein n=1 Tax=Pseudoalteromonas 'SMAR' TaxID=3416908 RepID=UPI003AF2F608
MKLDINSEDLLKKLGVKYAEEDLFREKLIFKENLKKWCPPLKGINNDKDNVLLFEVFSVGIFGVLESYISRGFDVFLPNTKELSKIFKGFKNVSFYNYSSFKDQWEKVSSSVFFYFLEFDYGKLDFTEKFIFKGEEFRIPLTFHAMVSIVKTHAFLCENESKTPFFVADKVPLVEEINDKIFKKIYGDFKSKFNKLIFIDGLFRQSVFNRKNQDVLNKALLEMLLDNSLESGVVNEEEYKKINGVIKNDFESICSFY